MSSPDAEVEDWDLLGYVTSSQYRRAILADLEEGAAIPTTIAEDVGYDLTHVSRSLTELRDRELVELLVSEDTTKGRYYGLTEQGEAVAEQIENLR